MKNKNKLFENILLALNKAGILQDIILIGSWVLPVYKYHFSNSAGIPILRTTDIDFLITNPPGIKKKVDVSAILKSLGFEETFSLLNNFTKFSHVDFEIEFLIPKLGRGNDKAIYIEELNVIAQPLRYLNFIQNNTIVMDFGIMKIRVPEPAAFVLMKYLLTIKRKDEKKIAKDLRTANELTDFLLSKSDQRKNLKILFSEMPRKWQRKLMKIIYDNCFELYKLLTEESET
ncbi:MAG: nucleotidyltransferase domain-containing protein [Candidatus Cloacimonetes bacterium]|nr:nucleotidyltransferase domain-containing protein [Candidatus Cloacimonadota bacterium]MCF7813468.1 nucleotidyltransferase domain-containing protein [Candidatus Cloacimonadota bacterium]MCF7869170.1 nucleotidyltransferase domain-containing protein [Candidatus Cloacimonadota bacterium]MCF7883396.1 nucleotidyltransferase domain-containing protein [Candidatus Cloacimonadota bacterium]